MKPYYDEGGITIYHGDCRRVMCDLGPVADVIIADPAYGETSLEWDRWCDGWPTLAAHAIKRSGSMWCFGSFRMFLEAVRDFGSWRFVQDVVWEKHNGSNFIADRFRRVHELVSQWVPVGVAWEEVYKLPVTTPDATKRAVRRKERPPHTGEIEGTTYISEDGGPRLMRSVQYVRSCHGHAVHPTQKPVGIITPLIRYSCPPGGVVLSPFMGSGSVLVAARDCGCRAIGVELQERYCEEAVSRLRQGVLFGMEARAS
jgi:site-specific DNA-methyltransferase (adenine-specific)